MDQLGAMRTFVRVVQMGSFSAVGREQNTGQATISKKVAALETHLGVKLLSRTSRELSLTESGSEYYDKCLSILGELDEVESSVRSQTAKPKGRLRIAAPIAFSRLVLAPLIGQFVEKYPDISIELDANDKHVDLIAEGVDLAIRAKQLDDSSLIARPLMENPLMVAASPDYLEAKGVPMTPEDLKDHNCILYSLLSKTNVWGFQKGEESYSVSVTGNFQSSNGDTNLEVALSGLGIIQLPRWMIQKYLVSGELVAILEDYDATTIPINIIYPQNRYVPLKVRCFIDFLMEAL